jgi:hypothetical protein
MALGVGDHCFFLVRGRRDGGSLREMSWRSWCGILRADWGPRDFKLR